MHLFSKIKLKVNLIPISNRRHLEKNCRRAYLAGSFSAKTPSSTCTAKPSPITDFLPRGGRFAPLASQRWPPLVFRLVGRGHGDDNEPVPRPRPPRRLHPPSATQLRQRRIRNMRSEELLRGALSGSDGRTDK